MQSSAAARPDISAPFSGGRLPWGLCSLSCPSGRCPLKPGNRGIVSAARAPKARDLGGENGRWCVWGEDGERKTHWPLPFSSELLSLVFCASVSEEAAAVALFLEMVRHRLAWSPDGPSLSAEPAFLISTLGGRGLHLVPFGPSPLQRPLSTCKRVSVGGQPWWCLPWEVCSVPFLHGLVGVSWFRNLLKTKVDPPHVTGVCLEPVSPTLHFFIALWKV